jgi:hypothetical protein
MTIRINEWINNAPIDYLAGRSAWDDTKRPVSVALLSAPGTSKSSQIQRSLPGVLERALFAPARLHGAKPLDLDETPDALSGAVVHFSPNRHVAVVTEMINTRDAPDLRGFMVPRKDGTSQYLTPDLLVIEQALYDMGVGVVVLFLDEFGGADHLLMKAMAPLFLDGQLGSFKLRPTTWVVGASNRQSDGAGVNRLLTLLTNRINIIETGLHIDDYCSYAAANLDMPPMVLAYARKNPGKVSIDQPPKDGPFPSYRSLTYAGEWMAAYMRQKGGYKAMDLPLLAADGAPDSYVQEKVAGFIGQGLMVELAGYAKYAQELPDIEDIERDPHSAKLPERHRMDALYAAAQLCVHHATPDNIEPLWDYVLRMPKEIQVGTATQLIGKGNGISINAPGIRTWLKENSALIRNSLAN